LKVIHVETGMHLYGGALQVFFLLRGLQDHPGEHVLVCPIGSAIADAAREFVRVVEIPCRGDHDLTFLWRLKRILEQERPDLVHLHSRRGADVLGGIAAKLAGVPAILSRRVDNPEPRWLVKLKYGLYQRIVTISEGIRHVLLAEGLPPEKVVCVPSAVDTQRYRPGCRNRDWFRTEFELGDNEKTIGMAAQFIPRKGHRTLIEAIPAILKAHPQTRFLLFGQGPEENAIHGLVTRNKLDAHVIFAGFRNDLDQILPCLDLLVHPAFMEGLGVILLQAAACGIPIVAGRAGGIPEIVQDGKNGYLITPGDPVALTEKINHLLANAGLAHQFGQSGRSRVESHFSIDAMVAGNRKIYKAILFEYR
jgi:glycosyltransferase involved in cell wall biosynthesis